MTAPETMHFDGPCPFLLCLEEGPHDHPICPDCGAVRYGNMFCETCQAHYAERQEELLDTLEELLTRALNSIGE